jgi:hypothetical protein
MQNLNNIDFVKTLNTLRLQNKGKWYTWAGTVNNKTVQIKGYATWLQFLELTVLLCRHVQILAYLILKNYYLIMYNFKGEKMKILIDVFYCVLYFVIVAFVTFKFLIALTS